MDGLTINNDDHNNTICIIDYISDEFKELIQNNLTSICQGISKGESQKKIYSYRNTLKEFLIRYDSKGNTTQGKNIKKGIIGELLSHIIFIYYFNEFQTISPLFNMEDRNIKKSFDVILFNTTNREIFYTEVKSGSASLGYCANQFDTPNHFRAMEYEIDQIEHTAIGTYSDSSEMPSTIPDDEYFTLYHGEFGTATCHNCQINLIDQTTGNKITISDISERNNIEPDYQYTIEIMIGGVTQTRHHFGHGKISEF